MTSEKLQGKQEQLRLVRELKNLEAYSSLLIPEFLKRAQFHTGKCKARDLSPEKRAEHIEAAHAFEEMVKFVEVLEKSLVETVKQIQEGRK